MPWHPSTIAIHADWALEAGPDLAGPIHVATTYDRMDQDDLVYRRDHHLTTRRLEEVLGQLEGGAAVYYPSGMAAVSSLLRYLAPARVVLPHDVYHGTRDFVEDEAANGTWELGNPDELDAGDVLWVETPSNPKCLVTDIAAAAGEAAALGAVTVVDSTFATPVLQQPLELGADFVLHSTTKFIGGHSDAMGGVVVGAPPDISALARRRGLDGTVAGPLDTYLALRGIRTLPLRIERQSTTAAALAKYLSTRVPTVWHPSLTAHPGHDIAARQMKSGGGVLSFEMEVEQSALDVLRRLQIFRRATSLGGVESLIEHRHSVDPAAPAGLLRISCGLEAPEDLMADLGQAIS